MRRAIFFICAACFVIGCSGDENNDNNTVIIVEDMKTTDQPDISSSDMSDMFVDLSDMVDMPDDTGFVREIEPNDSKFNATPFTVDRGFAGQIARSTDTTFDRDYFRFIGDAGTVLTFEIEQGPGFKADNKRGLAIIIQSVSTEVNTLVLTDNVNTRSVYLEADGEYMVSVQQLERIPNINRDVPHGGDLYNYSVKTSVAPAVPNQTTTWDTVVHKIESNGQNMPAIYPIVVEDDDLTEIYIRFNQAGQQLGDPQTGLWDPRTNQYVAHVTAHPREDDAFVAEYRPFRLPAGEYYLIIDNFLNPRIWDYEILVRKVEGSADYPIMLADGESYEGTIGEPFEWKGRIDRDVFGVVLEPNKSVKLTATELSEDSKTRLMVFDDKTGKTYHHAIPSEGGATMTIYNPNAEARQYRVIVDHHFNLIPETSMDPVGGPNYKYRITREDYTPFDEEVFGTRTEVDVPLVAGQISWLTVPTVQGSLWTVDLSEPRFDYVLRHNYEATDGWDFAFLLHSESEATDPQATFAYRTLDIQRVHVGIYDRVWINAPAQTMIKATLRSVDVSNITYTDVPVVDMHNTPQTAVSIDATTPVSIKGSLVSMANAPGGEFYAVNLLAGETLALITEADPMQAPTHTMLRVSNANGDVLAVQTGVANNNHIVAFPYFFGFGVLGGYAATLFEAPADGEYTIEVRAREDGMVQFVDGGYILKVAKVTFD